MKNCLESNLTMNTNGDVKLCERNREPSEHLGWDSNPLLDCNTNIELDVAVGWDAGFNDDGLRVNLSEYHILDEGSGRVFRIDVKSYLSLEEVERLHHYLGFILASGCLKKPLDIRNQ